MKGIPILLLTASNIYFCLLLFFRRESHSDPRTLRMPNQFYGLNQTFTEEPTAPWLSNTSVITFPTLLQQITREDISYIYPEDPRRYRSRFGTLSPEDRPLYVSSSISTIVQFKARDYGMERCVLKVILPNERIHSPPDGPIDIDRQRDWIPFSGSMPIDIWRLNPIPSTKNNPWIDPRALSFRNRPRRGEFFTTLLVRGGMEVQSPAFRCAENEVLSFELTCVGCKLDVWQDKQIPAMGMVMEQTWYNVAGIAL